MNLIRLGPEITFDRPLAPEAIGRDRLILIPPLAEIVPDSDIPAAARWRQVAFHSEQIDRLDGPQDLDVKRNMTEEMAELHRGELAKHLATLGVTEAAEQHPYEIAVEQRPSEIRGFDLEVAMAA